MRKFSANSRIQIDTCREELRKIAFTVLRLHPCVVIWGFRDKEAQDQLFAEKRTKLRFPLSNHNIKPSNAMDIAPIVNKRMVNGSQPDDYKRLCYFGGLVVGVAEALGTPVRWGGNWDQDEEILTDQRFDDLFHFELID